MNCFWGQLTLARKPVDHGGRLFVQGVQDVAISVGCGVGHRNAFFSQMLHEEQVEGQLFVVEAFKQGEHIFAEVGGGEIVGVFNATFDAL